MKENWIYAKTRHHSEPNINILLTSNFSFDSNFRQWSHLLMIPLQCLWGSNNGKRGQFECEVTWFYLCFGFVRSHALCGCCSIVCLHFQVLQIKQADSKLSTKNVNNYKLKTFRDVFGQLQTQGYKATKKQIVRYQLNEKKSKESQTRLMSWYWKRKLTWKKDLITYNSHPWIMYSFNWLVIIWRGEEGGGVLSFEIRHPRSTGWRNFGRKWTRGWESWKLDNFQF